MRYSLFVLQKEFWEQSNIVGDCCIFIDTFDTLELAQLKQKEYSLKTIILPSY